MDKCIEQSWLERIQKVNQPVILSYAYSQKPVMSTTIARYVKLFLGQVDIDVTVFSAHSTRSASTSKGNNLSLTIDDIHKAGGWKRNSTFRKYYKLSIHKNVGNYKIIYKIQTIIIKIIAIIKLFNY